MVSLVDRLLDGLSAVYTFFDPALAHRGLGVYGILSQVKMTREMGLANLYLGYWIEGCRKMAYKQAYRPLEMLVEGRWRPMDSKAEKNG